MPKSLAGSGGAGTSFAASPKGTCFAAFALLDDSGAPVGVKGRPATPSRLYTDLVGEHMCLDVAQLDQVCAAVEADLQNGLHAVVLADYEWGTALAGLASLAADLTPVGLKSGLKPLPASRPEAIPDSDLPPLPDHPPALRYLMFRQLQQLSAEQVEIWLAAREAGQVPPELDPTAAASLTVALPGNAGVMDLGASVTRAEFETAIAGVHAALQAGDAYQINYTFRLDFDVYGSPIALYRRLRARQPVSFGALIALPDGRWVLSCSPELFLDHHGLPGRPGHLSARPMKGTAPRLRDAQADREAGLALARDPKNRAENLMIVDLLRNDLGRIAQIGSVRVPALFSVEGHPTVWQMTSSVEAQLKPAVGFADVLRALFPCGSITGAPKHSAMQLIRQLESTPRGLYTGAIGWLEAAAPGHAAAGGPFCLSVAIRTLVLDAPRTDSPVAPSRGGMPWAPAAGPRADAAGDALRPGSSPGNSLEPMAIGRRTGRMGIGAGIVLDSVAADEYDECYLKARFLTGLDSGLSLFETMYAEPGSGVRYLEQHLARLSLSAGRLGFACDIKQVRRALQDYLDSLFAQADALGRRQFRVRLALNHAGQIGLSSALLQALADGPVKLVLARDLGLAATDANDVLLSLKTTRRAHYDAGWQGAEQIGAFDALFVNTRGELTEGGRSNLFVKLAGRWWTPPLDCGVLPGVMRQVLLDDPQWSAAQRRLTLDDLERAEALMVCNALRGPLPAQWITLPVALRSG